MAHLQTAEHAIEDMTQRGLKITGVYFYYVYDNAIMPIDDDRAVPSPYIILSGERADGYTESRLAYCTDFKWLREWWKGGWQANI